MQKQRRCLLALVPALALARPVLAAPDWPSRPLRLIVTFPPGGSSDIAARLVAPRLAQQLGQPVVVENRPGAGGGIGLDAMLKSPADGHTLVLAAAGAATINPSLNPVNYDPARDLQPISGFGTSPLVLVVNAKLPVQNVQELLALARSRPDALTYGSGGNGTAMHLAGALLAQRAGVPLLHVPYRGTSPAVTAVMAGETDLAIADVTSVQQAAQTGSVRLLAVLDAERSALAPELPTLAEAGVPGYDAAGWFAIFARAGTPEPIVEKLNTVFQATLNEPEVQARFAQTGLEPQPSSAAALGERVAADTRKWAEVIATLPAQAP